MKPAQATLIVVVLLAILIATMLLTGPAKRWEDGQCARPAKITKHCCIVSHSGAEETNSQARVGR